MIGYGLLSLIPIFLPWAATHYVIEHIEDHFWKLECKLNNEMELEERLEQLREQRLRRERDNKTHGALWFSGNCYRNFLSESGKQAVIL